MNATVNICELRVRAQALGLFLSAMTLSGTAVSQDINPPAGAVRGAEARVFAVRRRSFPDPGILWGHACAYVMVHRCGDDRREARAR